MCSTSTPFVSGHGIIFTLSKNMGIKSASASSQCFSWNRRGNFLVLLPAILQADWPTVKRCYVNTPTGVAARCASNSETEIEFSAPHGEDAQKWLKAAYARRWIRSWELIEWPSRPPYLTSIDLLMWGHLRCTFIQFLPELSKISWQDIRQPTSALKLTEAASDTYCSYEAQLFDQLIGCGI